MNLLFVLYYDFTSNSASHVRSLAEELEKLGHDCCVAVPFNKRSLDDLGSSTFQSLEFEEFSKLESLFKNGRGPDVIHAWTPREVVRLFCERVRSKHRSRLFVHLEDNEWHLLSCLLGQSKEEFSNLQRNKLDDLVPMSLSHPYRAMEFMESADGVTVIIDRLREFAPTGIPILELWPSADPSIFYPRSCNLYERRRLGIAENSTVISYTGNVHGANAHEMRSLYLAVAILNREAFPSTLVRTGRDYCQFLGQDDDWARRNVIDLGFIPYREVSEVLALADVLIQPGKPDDFNNYRFPSKLPEFLSIGRPVILPRANLGKHMEHLKQAYVLDDPSAVSTSLAVKEIMCDRELYRTLSCGSIEFFEKRLSWPASALKLQSFYATSLQPSLVRAQAT